MYRVRKAWNKPKTQIGAFENLLNAKLCALKAGSGYSVFDDTGKNIYKVDANKLANDWLRVRSSWADAKSQVAACRDIVVAKDFANKTSKNVYDWDGNEIYKSPNSGTNPQPAPTPTPTPSVDISGVRTMSYKAKVLKKIGKYAKGTTVEVTRNFKKQWVLPDGTTVEKDKRSTYFDLTKQIYDPDCKYSAAVAEAWINKRGTASSTDWLFWCNKYGQRVYVFKGSKGNWKLQKTYKCGTGNIAYGDGSDQGVSFGWKIWNKDKAFQGPQAMQYYNMHYSSAWGNSIHQGGTGKPGTHGCISLAKSAAVWCFENLPINTRVVVW